MKKLWPVVALGLIAYVIFAIATLPARLLTARLAPAIVAGGVHGTVWNGQAQVVQHGSTFIGSASWKLHALPLLVGRLQGNAKITRVDGFAQAEFKAGLSGTVELDDLTASVPLAALPFAPPGWTGTLNARLQQLTLENGWPVRAEGTIEINDLTGPAARPANMGNYKITFPPGSSGDELVGALTDQGGPLDLAGNVRLKADRSYVVEGVVAARPDAPRNVADFLQFLGPPDSEGRRPFSIACTL